MEELALQVRTFVYTMICFQCLVQLSVGNSFYKYLKLFSQLLALCICCNIFFSFIGVVDDGWEQADVIYREWQKQWSKEESLAGMDGYLENQIMEQSVNEFETQVAMLLETEGKGHYKLKELTQEHGKWSIVLEGEQGQENADFAVMFKERACREFSLGEDELEVRLR